MRATARICSRLGNVHWYAVVTTTNALALLADAPGEIALVDANGAELACSADASSLPIGALAGVGQTVYIAVLTAGPIGALTLVDIDYVGNGGVATDLGITWPTSATTDYGMSVGAGLVYLGGTTKVFSFPTNGNVMADEHGSADGILPANLGYSLTYAQGALFSASSTATTTTPRIHRIFDGATWGPSTWDTPPPYPATAPMSATAFDGAWLLYASRNTTRVDFYAIDPAVPGAPVSLGTSAGVGTVVGLAADTQYFYVAGLGRSGEGEGVFRVLRADPTAPPVQIAALDTSTIRNHIYIDDYFAPKTLYARAYGGDVHAIAEPASGFPVDVGAISTLGTTSDYAMALDVSSGLLYLYETEDDAAGRVIVLQ